MPEGYEGPVAFQTGWESRIVPKVKGADYHYALGEFQSQESGVYYTDSNGKGVVRASTAIYDYYNFNSTDPHWHIHPSDLGLMHRAGWAQNFDTIGVETPRSVPVQ